MAWLINATQLDKFRKSQKNVIILDASYHLAEANRDAQADFLERHIIGARFFDMSQFHDATSLLPNMLTRDERLISEKLTEMGITNDSKIIIYDDSDLHSSCRALWMLKVFGHPGHQLYILDGGYAAWQQFGGKIEAGERQRNPSKPYVVNFEAHYVRTLVQMKNNLHHPQEQVVDMRHPVRFAGGPEPRVGLRSGHIPGSFSFPYFTMFDTEKRFKSVEKMRKQLSGLGIDLTKSIVTTCGSGMTAAILNFVLDILGETQHALYDGSWSEWGAETLYPGEASVDERPVETSVDE